MKKQRTANLQLVKAANLSLVFHLINQYGQTSRAEIAHITGLSPTTVSSLVDELIAGDMVVECGTGESSTSGRKPVLIEVNPSGGYVAAIELNEDGFLLELYDLCGVCVDSRQKEIFDWENLGSRLIHAIEKAFSRIKCPIEKLQGICVGVPALLDKDARRVVASSVIPIDENNDFFKILQSRFRHIPVKMGVDSCFCAYSEKLELRRDLHSLVYININKGIGCGILLDDKLYTGAFGYAGEFGQLTVSPNDPTTIEQLASLPVIKARFAEAIARGTETQVKPRKDGSIPFASIARALGKDDKLAHRIIEETCSYLAQGIGNVIALLNPEAIVIGGRVTELGPTFLEILNQKVKQVTNRQAFSRTVLAYSCSQNNSVTNGCAQYLLTQIFDVNNFLVQ